MTIDTQQFTTEEQTAARQMWEESALDWLIQCWDADPNKDTYYDGADDWKGVRSLGYDGETKTLHLQMPATWTERYCEQWATVDAANALDAVGADPDIVVAWVQ